MASPSFEVPQQSRESQQPSPHQSVIKRPSSFNPGWGRTAPIVIQNDNCLCPFFAICCCSNWKIYCDHDQHRSDTNNWVSGGDGQLNALVWYSWLGRIIIGTMIGSNSVLEEHCRNVVLSGSTRGLGKALACEFLLSGDRVVVLGGSIESVQATVRELEENLKEGIANAGSFSRKIWHMQKWLA